MAISEEVMGMVWGDVRVGRLMALWLLWEEDGVLYSKERK